MLERSHGIVLRLRPLSESSVIVHWLAADAGRIATVARGARRPKSPFLGKLDLFVAAELSFVRSNRSTLHTLGEVVVTRRHDGLARDLRSLAMASYAVHAVELATETDTPIPEIHALFEAFLHHVESHPPAARSVLAFEVKLLACLGLEPDPAETSLPPAARDLLAMLLDVDWLDLPGLDPDPVAARLMKPFLHGFIIHHLGRLPRGRAEAFAGTIQWEGK